MQTDLQLPSQLPAFALIGPDVGYAGAYAQAKIFVPNCVLGRCVHVVFNCNATPPFFCLSSVEVGLKVNLDIRIIKFVEVGGVCYTALT